MSFLLSPVSPVQTCPACSLSLARNSPHICFCSFRSRFSMLSVTLRCSVSWSILTNGGRISSSLPVPKHQLVS